MDYGIIFMFIAGSFLHYFFWRNATRGMINEININNKLYPQHYTAPSRSIRKLYEIRLHKIPKYLYVQCYLAFIYGILGPVELLLYYFINDNGGVAKWLMFAHYCIFIVNVVIFLICSAVYKKNRKIAR